MNTIDDTRFAILRNVFRRTCLLALLLTGAAAYGVALVRDRLYAQDLSDLEFVAATITEPAP